MCPADSLPIPMRGADSEAILYPTAGRCLPGWPGRHRLKAHLKACGRLQAAPVGANEQPQNQGYDQPQAGKPRRKVTFNVTNEMRQVIERQLSVFRQAGRLCPHEWIQPLMDCLSGLSGHEENGTQQKRV